MASLLGRILRTLLIAFVAVTVLVTAPLQAAPFAAIVVDARTGEVLLEDNADARLHPASLTKMMTLYIAFQEIEAGRLSLDTKVTVTKYAASQPPSRLGLKPGQKIALRYLIRAAAVKSANDAASAIGDHISGDHVAFAKRMTRTAKQLGMASTTFRNANGLTADGHLSTARDMNTLGRHLFYDFPQYYNIFSRRTADAGVATVTNTNSRFLDAYEGADGIKTGYTSAAGFNLTASAVRGNKRIIATVFGGTSTANRNAKMKELMDIGFGAAKNRVKEQPPQAPSAPAEEALIASTTHAIDDLDAEGGAAKTVRVSGAVTSSPRPKARPVAPTVPDAVAIAMADGIADALAEATAEPPPEGTLEFQAAAIASGESPVAAEAPLPEAVAETQIAAAAPAAETAPLPAGSLEAQAAALAANTAPVADLAEETVVIAAADPGLADVKPMPRPEAAAETVEAAVAADAEATAEAVLPVEELQVAAAPELVVTDPGTDPAADPAPEDTTLTTGLLAEITDVETVAGATASTPPDTQLAAAATLPDRQAPIFDSVEVAAAEPEPTQEVVVVMSTSGGRHFGVNVGEYPSRYEAERALLKTALAESATLNEGLRKTAQSNGSWRASFLGLTEEQAELACRRLRARAVPCETVGG
ncbi:D-alanyl-D-alanine carboxypeptidase family protein [Tabrizicola piscis]|uniref:D-alanyl-D-alanine carboxypeptidase family protein n=1 Tax=Tabrizicola piscis TaxID=2494374 RepID=UPI001FE9EC94|nr:D-alanyl-D-alanine carboxypeptidase family protein [Tabrizicola piscis]